VIFCISNITMQPRSFALIVVLVSIVRARRSALPEANAFWKKENAALLKMPLESGEMNPGEKQVGTETAMEKLTKQETKTKDEIKKIEKEKDVLEKKKEALENKSASKKELQKVEKEIENEDKDEIEKLKKEKDILEKEKKALENKGASKKELQKVEKEIEKEDEMEKKLEKEIKTIEQEKQVGSLFGGHHESSKLDSQAKKAAIKKQEDEKKKMEKKRANDLDKEIEKEATTGTCDSFCPHLGMKVTKSMENKKCNTIKPNGCSQNQCCKASSGRRVSAPANDILNRLDHRNFVFGGVFLSVALLLFLRARKQAQEDSVHSALLNSTEQEI